VLLSEFGLSMHLETQRGDETRNVLIDFGYSSPTLLNNLDILRIDPAKLDAMVLSHGHYDHFGGMVGFLAATQGKRKPKLPLYIGGEECFCSRQFTAGLTTPLNFGALDRKAIAEADLSVTTAEASSLIADHAFATGHIPRATFERVLSPTRMKVGVENGLGCFPDKMPADRRPIDWAPDEFDHEISTCVNLKGRGLVLLTSCGHRGLVNSVASDGGVGRAKGPRSGWRFPFGPAQGGISAPDHEGTGRSRRRLHRSDALHGRTILRDAQGGIAEESDSVIYRHQTRVR
jgi:7,8-dihydropterin-6-yl-methyl-4-(beta-D-ribofuranosyl)aminobenzene 5'-phosphate synthase